MSLPSEETSPALLNAWILKGRYSDLAGQLKAGFTRWRMRAFGLGMSAAVLETLASQVSGWGAPAIVARGLALLGSLAIAGAAVLLRGKANREQEDSWRRSRLASESIKSEAYQFLAGTGRYRDPDCREGRLAEAVREVQQNMADLDGQLAAIPAGSATLPVVSDVATYTAQRVDHQVETYYEPSAAREARRARRWSDAQFWLGLVAAGLGVLAGFMLGPAGIQLVAWVAVLTTLTAAIAAHAATERFDFLAATYTATALELRNLKSSLQRTSTQEADHFVERCEAVIAAQNQAWMGRRR